MVPESRDRILILGLAILWGAYQLAVLPATPVIEADSGSYLLFFPIRTAGYPLFLRWFGAEGAMVAQPVLHALALAGLGFAVRAATENPWPALGAVLALGINPEMNKYHAHIMTESLFATL
ncbi:MAG: hypothetical protein ABT940_09730, partial [Alphaproteobacteria bacterium]